MIEDGHTAKVHITCVEFWGACPSPALRSGVRLQVQLCENNLIAALEIYGRLDNPRKRHHDCTPSTSSPAPVASSITHDGIPIYSITSVITRNDEFGAYIVLFFDNGTLVLSMN